MAVRTNPWHALAVLCLANFLILLDTTIVNIALPDLQATLDAGIDEALWVLNGYLLAFASLLIVFGRLGDLAGPRTVFVAGLALFTVASALCGLAPTAGTLVAARVLQGVGAAALLPQALVLISAIFPAQRRGAAFGIFTAVAGLASVSGLTVGGIVVTELGWRWVFYLNLPVGLAGLVLALRLVPDLRIGRRHRFDLIGVLLATAGLVGIVYVLVEGQRHGWGEVEGPVTIPLVAAVSVGLLVLFGWWERRQPEPLLALGLFRVRDFTLATLITLITSFALFGLLLVLVLQLQVMLGMSALAAGLAALPWVVVLSVVAPIAGRLADRVGGAVLLVAGLAVYAAGTLLLAVLPTTTSSWTTFLVPLVVVGIGTGMTIAPATTEAMRPIAAEQAGAAAGVLNTARQVGAALGVAVAGAVLQNRLAESLRQQAAERVLQLPVPARAPYLDGFEQAGSNGLLAASRLTLVVVAVVIAAGGLLALVMWRNAAKAGSALASASASDRQAA